MSVNFNLSVSCQSIMFFEGIKLKTCKKLIEISEHHINGVRFSGLPTGLCFTFLSLVKYVSTIGESIIKGIANIFGSLFSENCKLARGVKQIFVQIPAQIFTCALDVTLGLPLNLIIIPLGMLISPISMLKQCEEAAVQTNQELDAVVKRQVFNLHARNSYDRNTSEKRITVLKYIYA